MAVPGQAGLLDPAGSDFEGGEQGRGAMTDVVVGGALRQPRADRQDRRGPVQRLDLRLLINTEHDGLLRRVQIQPDDIADLGVELGVGGELERLGPPGLQIPLAPDPGHRGEGNPQLRGQQPRRPVRHSQMRRRAAVLGEGGHHHVDLVDLRRPPTARHDPAAPPIPPASYRARQSTTVGRWSRSASRSPRSATPRPRATRSAPAAARPARIELDRVRASSRDRSPSRSTSGAATDIPHCSAPPTVNRVTTRDSSG